MLLEIEKTKKDLLELCGLAESMQELEILVFHIQSLLIHYQKKILP